MERMRRNEMTIKEVLRLIDWLMARGMSEKDAIECLRYIGSSPKPKEIGSSKPTKR